MQRVAAHRAEVLAGESVEVVGARYWGDPYGMSEAEGLFWMS